MAIAARTGSPRSCEAGLAADEHAAVAAQTDSYFLKTKAIVGHFGDRPATYAVFMRRPVICAPRFAIEFLEKMAAERGQNFDIELSHPEGNWVGAGDPILYIGGGPMPPRPLPTPPRPTVRRTRPDARYSPT